MEDSILLRQLPALLDNWLARHLRLEAEAQSNRTTKAVMQKQTGEMQTLLSEQFDAIDAIVSDNPATYQDTKSALQRHLLFSHFFLQTDIVASRHSGTSNAPFPFDFRQTVFGGRHSGLSAHARILNAILFRLPLPAAMQRLTKGIGLRVRHLPIGAEVLAVGAAPNPEILEIDLATRRHLKITVSDNDAAAVKYVMCRLPDVKPILAADGSADLALTEMRFDLIYSPYEFSGMPKHAFSAQSPAALRVQQLFALLKPGGTLLISMLLPTGGFNPYRASHRMLFETPCNTVPTYWTPAEMISFTDSLPSDIFEARLLSEDVSAVLNERAVIANLEINRSGPSRG
jgi:hypothetical protein